MKLGPGLGLRPGTKLELNIGPRLGLGPGVAARLGLGWEGEGEGEGEDERGEKSMTRGSKSGKMPLYCSSSFLGLLWKKCASLPWGMVKNEGGVMGEVGETGRGRGRGIEE